MWLFSSFCDWSILPRIVASLTHRYALTQPKGSPLCKRKNQRFAILWYIPCSYVHHLKRVLKLLMDFVSEDVSLSHRNVVLPGFCCFSLIYFIVVAFQLSTAIWKTIYLLPFYTQCRSFFYSVKGNWKWLIIVNGATLWLEANKDTLHVHFKQPF